MRPHELQEIISKNKANRNTIVNAYILLKADRACGWTYEEIATAYSVSTKKIERVKNVLLRKVLQRRCLVNLSPISIVKK